MRADRGICEARPMQSTDETTDETQSANPAGGPVFILSTSRSGSTLLRFIMDSHPEFACPPETAVGTACVQLARMWETLEHAGTGDLWNVNEALAPSLLARTAVRKAIDRAYSTYLRRRGKARWCDKSLDSYQYADVLLQIFPEAKFICLVRHCMDVIASGVEACPWGLHRFGYDPYVAQFPGNSVAAIGAYWLSCVQTVEAFREKHPDICHLVRYEDLASMPEDVTGSILEFLGARQAPGLAEACFRMPHDSDGPGDEKIWFTSGVNSDSVGRGTVVPVRAFPPPMLEDINETLSKLRYRSVGEDWNSAPGKVDPRADTSVVAEWPASPERSAVDCVRRDLTARLESCPPSTIQEIATSWPSVAETEFSMVIESPDGHHEELRWHFAPSTFAPVFGASGRGGTGKDLTRLIAPPSTWLAMLEGRSNVVSEITGGHLRCISPSDVFRIRSNELHAVAAALGLAKIPVARYHMLSPDDLTSAAG
jgi:hypothetical protein